LNRQAAEESAKGRDAGRHEKLVLGVSSLGAFFGGLAVQSVSSSH
jgi:hypothetical protein